MSSIVADTIATPVPATTRRDLLRFALLAAALLVGLFPTFRFVGSMIWFREFLGDFQVFWGIGAAPVDWAYGHYAPVFAYPPTALLLLRPFGLLPFWPAFVAWGLLGVAAISLAARRTIGPRAIAIGFASSAAVAVLAGGQISLFIGALVIGGLGASSPRWRGALLAAAAVIKPQSLIAAPVALFAERNWRAICWGLAAATVLLLLSVALFGVDSWLAWARELPAWQTFVLSRGIDRDDVGIYGLLRTLGLPGWTYTVGIPLGIATSWLVFRNEARLVDRYAAFVCATVLMSPYTLPYDLAGLSLACTAMLLDKDRSPLAWLAAALILSSVFANVGIVMMALVLSYEALSKPHISSSAAFPR
jgi:hypothetical protein